MNKTNMLKWIEALESGKYGQGTGLLRSQGDRFCCLGVACDIAGPSVGGEWWADHKNEWSFFVGAVADKTHLPAEVCKWLGVPFQYERAIEIEGEPITNLNDTRLWSFGDIAAGLRKKYGLHKVSA